MAQPGGVAVAKHTVGQYLRQPFKPYFLPITIFSVIICWAVAYGALEAARRMFSDGHIIEATATIVVGSTIIVWGLYVYARITHMIKSD